MRMGADTFFEVFSDVRFPLIAIDVQRVRRALDARRAGEVATHVAIKLDGPPGRRATLVSALRGLLSTIDLTPPGVVFLAALDPIARTGYSQRVAQLVGRHPRFAITEASERLVWEEDSPRPAAYSTILQQLVNVLYLHKHLIEIHLAKTSESLMAAGFAPENVQTVSEFPRQLPTHVHYAMASLGAWLGGR
jgi:hypothetical protein